MSSAVASSLSEFTKRSELANSPLAAESSNEPSLRPTKPNLIMWIRGRLYKLVSSAVVRYMLAIFIGVVATLAWQSYSGAARKTIAGWSPRLAWLAPADVPHGISAERIKATSLALATVHQSVDKLETEIGKLEAQAGSDRTATSPQSRRGSRRP